MLLSQAEYIIDTRRNQIQHVLLDKSESWDQTIYNPWDAKFESEKISYLWFLKLKAGWVQDVQGNIREVVET